MQLVPLEDDRPFKQNPYAMEVPVYHDNADNTSSPVLSSMLREHNEDVSIRISPIKDVSDSRSSLLRVEKIHSE